VKARLQRRPLRDRIFNVDREAPRSVGAKTRSGTRGFILAAKPTRCFGAGARRLTSSVTSSEVG
jgi:hypothetical protein